MKIKICGLSREQDIEYANLVRPDYIGFVFARSRRQVTPEQAARLRGMLSKEVEAVGVFVDESPERIIRCLQEGTIELAQLHGEEKEEDIRRIRKETGKQVIKAVKVRSRRDIYGWLDSEADYLLFDHGQGTGHCFDWKLLKGIDRPFFLAGGVGLDNIREAKKLGPYAVDISSGAEKDGYKDLEKMKLLMEWMS